MNDFDKTKREAYEARSSSPFNRRAGIVLTSLSLFVVFVEAFVLPGQLDQGYFELMGVFVAVSAAVSLYAGFRWQESRPNHLPIPIRVLATPPMILFATIMGLMGCLAYFSDWRR
jgi:hypothetical protein